MERIEKNPNFGGFAGEITGQKHKIYHIMVKLYKMW